MGSDFLRTAQAKGLTRRRALFKHGLRTALIPMATLLAYSFGTLVVGATFTEKIFGWHGMGEWLVDSITSNDINVDRDGHAVHRRLHPALGLPVRRHLRRPRPARAGLVTARKEPTCRCPQIRCSSPTTSRSPVARRDRRTARTSSSGPARAGPAPAAPQPPGRGGRRSCCCCCSSARSSVPPIYEASPAGLQRPGLHGVPAAAVGQPLVRHHADRRGRLRPDHARAAEVAAHRPAASP